MQAVSTFCSEAEATERELMAIYGWKDPALARRYTDAASKKKLAEGSIHKLSGIAPDKTTKERIEDKSYKLSQTKVTNFSEGIDIKGLLGGSGGSDGTK